MDQDAHLVSRVLQGSPQAFRQLVQQHERLVWHMVSRVVSHPEDSEDICQEVFLRVYQKLPTFHFQSKLSTWIATIAYRTAINYVKKDKRHAQETLDQPLPQVAPEAQDQLEKEALYTYVHQLINKLPVHYKTVLTLFHLEEMSLAEIHEVTGMPTGTIKNYLFRARKRLKDQVHEYFLKE